MYRLYFRLILKSAAIILNFSLLAAAYYNDIKINSHPTMKIMKFKVSSEHMEF